MLLSPTDVYLIQTVPEADGLQVSLRFALVSFNVSGLKIPQNATWGAVGIAPPSESKCRQLDQL